MPMDVTPSEMTNRPTLSGGQPYSPRFSRVTTAAADLNKLPAAASRNVSSVNAARVSAVHGGGGGVGVAWDKPALAPAAPKEPAATASAVASAAPKTDAAPKETKPSRVWGGAKRFQVWLLI